MSPRVMMAGGGTAGHLFPCLAVAEELALLVPDLQVRYIGAEGRIDARVLAERELPHDLIPALPLPYRMSPEAIAGFRALVRSTQISRRLIANFAPDVIFSTGGYVGAAVALAGRLSRVPVVLHVSDVLPDRANRMLSRWAAAITVATPLAAANLKCDALVTGHPIRREVVEADRDASRVELGVAPGQPLIVVTGGSQGARTINYAVLDALPTLVGELGARVVHLCGSLDYDDLKRRLAEGTGEVDRYDLIDSIPNMGPLLAAADLVIARAGAASLAESCLHGAPMLVVPYPHAGGHQRLNAEPLVEAGAAVMVDNAEFTGERLAELARELLGDRDRLAAMADASRAAGYPDAARDVAEVVARTGGFAACGDAREEVES